MTLSRYDRSNVTQYIKSLIAQPSHFNSNKVHYSYGVTKQYVEEIAAACGEQRGAKGSRLELPDLKPVAEKLSVAADQITREFGAEMLQAVNSELRRYTPPNQVPKTPALDRAFQNLDNAPSLPLSANEHNPYAAHAGTGRCPTCRQPLPGSGR